MSAATINPNHARKNTHVFANPAQSVNDDYDFEANEEEEEDNEFAGEYYWDPAPEWKTIGLVAGGAALVGLGALLHSLFDN